MFQPGYLGSGARGFAICIGIKMRYRIKKITAFILAMIILAISIQPNNLYIVKGESENTICIKTKCGIEIEAKDSGTKLIYDESRNKVYTDGDLFRATEPEEMISTPGELSLFKTLYYRVDGETDNHELSGSEIYFGSAKEIIVLNEDTEPNEMNSVTVVLDNTAPSISKNDSKYHDNGIFYTNNSSITFELSDTENGVEDSGIEGIKYWGSLQTEGEAILKTAVDNKVTFENIGESNTDILFKTVDKLGNESDIYKIVYDNAAPMVVDLGIGETKYVNTSPYELTLEDSDSGAKGIKYWTDSESEDNAILIECKDASKIQIENLDIITGDGEKSVYFRTIDKVGNVSDSYYTIRFSNTFNYNIEEEIDGIMTVLPMNNMDSNIIHYANQNTIYVRKNDRYSRISVTQVNAQDSKITIDETGNELFYVIYNLEDGEKYNLTILDRYGNRNTQQVVCDTTAPELNTADNNIVWTKESSIDISDITEITSGVNWNRVEVDDGTINENHDELKFAESDMECTLKLFDYAGNCNIYTIKRDISVDVSITKSGKPLVPDAEMSSNYIVLSPSDIVFDFSNEETGIKTFKVTKGEDEVIFGTENNQKILSVSDSGTYIVEIVDEVGNTKRVTIEYRETEISMQLYADENKTKLWAAFEDTETGNNAYGNGADVYLSYSDAVDPNSITIDNASIEGNHFCFTEDKAKVLKYKGWNEEDIRTVILTYDTVVQWKIKDMNRSKEIQSITNEKEVVLIVDDVSGLLSVFYSLTDENNWIEITKDGTEENVYINEDNDIEFKLSEFGENQVVFIKIIDRAGNTAETSIQYDSTRAKIEITDMEYYEIVRGENTYEYYIKGDAISDFIINHVVNMTTILLEDESVESKNELIENINRKLEEGIESCEVSYSSTNDGSRYQTIITKDKTAPDFELVYAGESVVINQWIQSSASDEDEIIKIRNITDDGSGLKEIVYTCVNIDGKLLGESIKKTEQPEQTLRLWELRKLGITDGTNYIHAVAYDNLDNSSEKTIEICYDTTEPKITIAVIDEESSIWKNEKNGELWIKSGVNDRNTLIKVTSLKEDISCISELEFSIDGENSYSVDYEEDSELSACDITLDILKRSLKLQKGENIITAIAYDLAGNQSESRVILYYDDTKPTFTADIENSKVYTDSSDKKWIKAGIRDTDIIININDLTDSDGSGIEKVVYQLKGYEELYEKTGSNAYKGLQWKELAEKLPLKEGSNCILITAYDNVGNASETKELCIYYDKTPPTFTAGLNEKVLVKSDEKKWIKAGIKDTNTIINIKNLTDSEGSGIEKVVYQLKGYQEPYKKTGSNAYKGLQWEELAKKLPLKEGSNCILITAYDNVGNASETKELCIYYDKTPPTISAGLNESKIRKDSEGKKWIKPTAKENDSIIKVSKIIDRVKEGSVVSGIDKVEYICTNEKNEEIGTLVRTAEKAEKNVILSELIKSLNHQEGMYKISIRAYDIAGNSSKVELSIGYDKTPPTISAELNQKVLETSKGEKWIKSNIEENDSIVGIIKLEDSCSGVNRVEYHLKNKTLSKSKTGDFGLTWKELKEKLRIQEGLNLLEIRAYDNAGNPSELTLSIGYDKTPPTLKTSINKEVIWNADKNENWIKAGTASTEKIIIIDTLEDAHSGIDKIVCSGVGEDGLPYTFQISNQASITLSELKQEGRLREGKNIITITAYDKVGNISRNEKIISYDTKVPEIPVIYLNEKQTDPEVSVRTYGHFFNKEIQLLIKTTDGDGSGIDTINVNGLPVYLKGVAGYKTIDVGTKEKLLLMIKDNVGNELNVTEQPGVIVEDEALHALHSAVNISIPETGYRDSNGIPLYKSQESVPVSISVQDDFSGIRSVEWIVTSNETDRAYEESGKINVDADGKVYYTAGTGESAQTGFSIDNSFLSVKERDNNLITKLEGTLGISRNSNEITVTVILTDNAMNVTTRKITFSNDTTSPIVTISYDNNSPDGTYQTIFKDTRTATIRIQERNFNAEDVMITAESTEGKQAVESQWSEIAGSGNNDDLTHIKTITFAEDGEYTVHIAYKDLAGNEAVIVYEPDSVAADTFTIDRTNPVIHITYDNNDGNNGYFKDSRTATITVNEHNFSADRIVMSVLKDGAAAETAISGWSSNGDVHSAAVTFEDEAQYTIQAGYTDMAGNVAVQTINDSFYIDKSEPEIKITGVENEKAYNSDTVAFRLEASDFYFEGADFSLARINSDGNKTEIEVKERSLENGKEIYVDNLFEDGIYQLIYIVTDKAGRIVQDELQFSINRYGSTYAIDNYALAMNKTYMKSVDSDITITEINVSELDMNSVFLVLTRGSSTIELKEGVDYTIEKIISNDKWCRYVYTIKKSCFDSDGIYSLSISSKDALGNISVNDLEAKQADISFVVDKTLPLCNIINLKSNETYATDRKSVEIAVSDNIKLAKVSVFLNGAEVMNLSETDIDSLVQADKNITIDILSKSTAQNLEVVFEDKAGNRDTAKISGFYVTTNLWIRYRTNPTWIALSIAGVLVIIGGILIIIAAKKKRNNK